MLSYKSFLQQLPGISAGNFEKFSLELFRYQVANNPIYHKYTGYLGIQPENITSLYEIPFMPVDFFKRHLIQTERWEPVLSFTSSGTTGSQPSRHPVRDPLVYLENTKRIFLQFYDDPEEYHIFGLLPSYLERSGSSLVTMVDHFLKLSQSPYGGFFLNDFKSLMRQMDHARVSGDRKILLIGVSFALMDLAEKVKPQLGDVIIMETGGMKGRRRELTRNELHEFLSASFRVGSIHSEYGMTEMFSQAYSGGQGIFSTPDTMKVILRDPNDPLDVSPDRDRGAINVIDLANIHSCAFIATDDVGVKEGENDFRVLGRLDNSDIRGCNLMLG